MSILEQKKIAITYDWITGVSGTDRVLKAVHEIFPEAPICTLFGDDDYIDELLPEAQIFYSELQNKYRPGKSPSRVMLSIPSEMESFDLNEYDVVISLGAAFSKSVITRPDTMQITYCYSPIRQCWDWTHEQRRGRGWLSRKINTLTQHGLRLWDRPVADRTDHYMAISNVVHDRIKKYYQKNSRVIYPPVHLGNNESKIVDNEQRFLIVSRLYKHKNIDIAVKAFNKLGWPLTIIGDGPDKKRLQHLAASNVSIIGYQPDEVVQNHYRQCSVFIMPQEEDFGIAAIEAMSHGKPVLALRRGGALEYIKEGVNGMFFEDAFEGSLANGARLIKNKLKEFNPQTIRESIEHFNEERFKQEFKEFIVEKIYAHNLHHRPTI